MTNDGIRANFRQSRYKLLSFDEVEVDFSPLGENAETIYSCSS